MNCGGGGIRRSSSSEPLLESAPASHRTPAVDAVGEEEAVETAMVAAYPREAAETAAAAAVVESQEKLAPMAAATNKGFDMKLGEAARNKGGGTCSPGEAAKQEQEMEMEGKKKKKKRRSWLPDPQKRWPVQGCLCLCLFLQVLLCLGFPHCSRKFGIVFQDSAGLKS